MSLNLFENIHLLPSKDIYTTYSFYYSLQNIYISIQSFKRNDYKIDYISEKTCLNAHQLSKFASVITQALHTEWLIGDAFRIQPAVEFQQLKYKI